jgi:hypothetical protein
MQKPEDFDWLHLKTFSSYNKGKSLIDWLHKGYGVGEVYLIQHYVIKFVSDLRQVSGFLRVLWFPPPIKLTNNINEILLKVELNAITLV